MVEAGLIVLTIVFILVMALVSTYLFIYFCHVEEKQLGSHVALKVVVVLGLTLAWSLPMELPLDVANYQSNGGLNMEGFTAALQSLAVIYVGFIAPFAIFFYQSDEDDSLPKRLLWSFIYSGICLALALGFLFITYSFLGISNSSGLRTTVLVYMVAMMSTFGWVLLVFFAGYGLIFLPADFILKFFKRPRALKSNEAEEKKEELKARTVELAQRGQQAERGAHDVQNTNGWWAKRKAKSKYEQQVKQFKEEAFLLVQDYQIFEEQLHYSESNPAIYFGYLVLGIFCALLSLGWWIQVLIGSCIFVDGKPLYPFFGSMFAAIQASGAGIVGCILYALLVFYLMAVFLKGAVGVGVRVPYLFQFHPLVRNQTFLNSLLFNVVVLTFGGAAIMQLACTSFSSYSAGSYLFLIFTQVNSLRMYDFIYTRNVFPISLLVYSGLALIYLILRLTCLKEYFSRKERRERKDKELEARPAQDDKL